MEIKFIAHTILTLDHTPGSDTSRHVSCGMFLDALPPLDSESYCKQGLLTKEGSQVMTNVLVQGLISNIHLAHQKGWKDSAENLRFIISELERGFVQVAEIRSGKLFEGNDSLKNNDKQ